MAKDASYTNEEVYQIGQEHRAIIWLILLQILAFPVARVLGSAANTPATAFLVLPIGLLPLMINIVSLVFVYRLASSLKNTSALVFLCLGLIPCISLISLLVLSSRAQAALKSHGVAVGLMGASRADLERLVEDDNHDE